MYGLILTPYNTHRVTSSVSQAAKQLLFNAGERRTLRPKSESSKCCAIHPSEPAPGFTHVSQLEIEYCTIVAKSVPCHEPRQIAAGAPDAVALR